MAAAFLGMRSWRASVAGGRNARLKQKERIVTFKSSDWLVSTWDAGQSSIMTWSRDNVRFNADGSTDFLLSKAPDGTTRPYLGGEIQSYEVATTGTWSWTAKAPQMVDGAVFGMFLYQEDYRNDPWLEYDFEFVGADTTKVQLNIHMEDAQGRHISLDQAKGGPVIVDLGFDAATREAHYEVTVTDRSATFRIDGKVVGQFDASDMPGGVWYSGPMKSLVDLWAVAPGQEAWAGDWTYPGTPLVATVDSYEIRPGEFTTSFHAGTQAAPDADAAPAPVEDAADEGPVPITGTSGDDLLQGTDAAEAIDGFGGNDRLHGGGGNDVLAGGDGRDDLSLDAGDDLLDGGAGTDWLRVSGTTGVTVDLGQTAAQATGLGTDTIRGIENIEGGGGRDLLTGNAGDNHLRGGDGNDVLRGGAGNDSLFGLAGADTVHLDEGDDRIGGGNGTDWLFGHGSRATFIDLGTTAAQWTGYGMDRVWGIENLSGGSVDDRLKGTSEANHLRGNDGNDTLVGRGGNDRLEGGAGNDKLVGGPGADVLMGGSGADRLVGGSGRDTLTGGTGADVFVFGSTGHSPAGSARDVIRDFERGLDMVDLRRIDADDGASGDQAFGFSGTTAQAHSVWTSQSGADLVLRGDVNGDRTADFEILLIDETGFSSANFML